FSKRRSVPPPRHRRPSEEEDVKNFYEIYPGIGEIAKDAKCSDKGTLLMFPMAKFGLRDFKLTRLVNLLLNRWMKDLGKIFYGNIVAYDAAIIPAVKQEELQNVIWRNVFFEESSLKPTDTALHSVQASYSLLYPLDFSVSTSATEVNQKASESLAGLEEYPNLFEDWQVALAVESKVAETRLCVQDPAQYKKREQISPLVNFE
ncbi:unnamed protein product, partial [Ilex paraguariensis]